MSTPRSPEMWLAAYFLARCGMSGGSAGYPEPPARLRAPTWSGAYAMFWPVLGDGRDLTAFRNSLKNARDTFDSHLSIGRVGWRADNATGAPREPQPLPTLGVAILQEWSERSDSELWARVSTWVAQPPGPHA